MASWKQRYTLFTVIGFNTLVLLLAVNLALWAAEPLFHRHKPFDPIATFGIDRVLQCYPGWKPVDVVALQAEMARLDANIYEYEPYTQFKHRPLRGKYLNIDAAGFRPVANQKIWPPGKDTFNIFVFGGSTTFGVGVPDNQTIPAYLQQALETRCTTPIAVYNFGRLGYFSTQEALLFYRLLSSGVAPQVAVFVDGINDFHSTTGEPDLTTELKSLLNAEQQPSFLRDLPMTRAVSNLGRSAAGGAPNAAEPRPEAAIARLQITEAMIESLSAASHAATVFVLQPVPVYKYDMQYHYLHGLDYSRYFRYANGAKLGYPVMAQHRVEFETGRNFLWLADMQEGRAENFYLSDGLHYTAAMCHEIADRIYTFMSQKGLLAPPSCDAAVGKP